jgi:adenosylcobinamide-GDP ribazoletransferase
MTPWWIALQFLSSLPVRLARMPTAEETGKSLLCYPLVGLVFGIVLWLLEGWLGSGPLLLHAALLLVVWVALTGGLHLDGLADTADAWVGGYGDRERTLAIMKDPRSGPMAVVALMLLLLLKFSALVALLQSGASHAWLLVPMLGRAALLGLFLSTPYARAGGLGQALANHLPRMAGWWVLGVCLVVGVTVMGANVAVGLAAFLWLRWMMVRRLGGTTGDTAGALVECLEAVLLVAMALDP